MDKKTTVILVIAAIVAALALGAGVMYARLKADVEIARVTAERDVLREERRSVEALARRNDSLQGVLGEVRVQLQTEATRRRNVVDQLEEARVDTVLGIRSLRTTSEIADRFARTFPEVTAAPWGIEEVYIADRDVSLEMVMIHISALDQFMVEHENALSFQTQVDTLRTVVELQDSITTLGDSIFVLERQTRVAYVEAYDNVFGRYEDLNARYLSELRKPRFGINLPTFGVILGSAAVGFAIGAR